MSNLTRSERRATAGAHRARTKPGNPAAITVRRLAALLIAGLAVVLAAALVVIVIRLPDDNEPAPSPAGALAAAWVSCPPGGSDSSGGSDPSARPCPAPTPSPTEPAWTPAPVTSPPQPSAGAKRSPAAPHTEPGAPSGAYPAMPFDPVTSKVAADVQAFWDAMMRVQAAQNAVMVGERALAEQRQALADAAIKLLAARLRRNELAPTTQDSARRLYPDSRADPPVTSEPALPEAPVLNLLAFSDRAERRLAQYRKAVREVRRLEPIVDARQHAVERLAADLAERRRRLTQEESALAELRWRVDQNAAAARRPRAGRAADPAQRSQVDGNAGPTAGDRRDSPPTSYSGGRLLQPVRGRLSSRFGNRYDPYYHVYQLHAGADFAAPKGTTIRAAAAGRVARAGVFGGYGRFVCIEHGRFRDQRLSTCYAHQSRILVRVGLQVAAGEPIGLVGSTGASTGPHLHFEVRLGGRPVDPLPWL